MSLRRWTASSGPAAGWRTSCFVAALGLLAFPRIIEAEVPSVSSAKRIRVIYTASVFRDIAEGDARAAIKAWIVTLAKECSVDAFGEVEVVSDVEELARRTESNQTDLGGATALEYFQVEDRLDADPLFTIGPDADPTIEYLVLVKQQSAYQTLADLQGRSLRWYDNPRTSMATPWLELELSSSRPVHLAEFFDPIEATTKLSGVVLPVFFGQADACVVTRRGFQTMVELNPQLERELRALVESPPLVPMISFLRRTYDPPYRDDVVHAVRNLHTSPTGRQILTLMQGDRSVVLTDAQLAETRALVRRWRAVIGQATADRGVAAPSTPLADGNGR